MGRQGERLPWIHNDTKKCQTDAKQGQSIASIVTSKKQETITQFGINFYNSMWPRRTHVMAPLTEMTGDVPL